MRSKLCGLQNAAIALISFIPWKCVGRRARFPILNWHRGRGSCFLALSPVSQTPHNKNQKAFMQLSHRTKQSPPHPHLPVHSPPLFPHPLSLATHCPTTEMSRQRRALQEEVETRSRQLEEEVRRLREQLGRLPHLQSPFSQRVSDEVQPEGVSLGWSFSRRSPSLTLFFFSFVLFCFVF